MKLNNFINLPSKLIFEAINRKIGVKHLFSNYYGIDLSNVSLLETDKSLFLSKDFGNYCRIYILSDDLDEIIETLSTLPPNSVINIPSRNGIDEWANILNLSGYKQIALYHRFVYRKYPIRKIKKIEYAINSDHQQIRKLLSKYFSSVTGHLPNDEELLLLIEKKNIIVNRDDNNEVNGALCFNIEGKKCYLAFWFDESGMGLSLLNNIFGICSNNEIKMINFWVNDNNTDVIKIHTLFGATPDGMKDYIFNNNL